MLVDSHCHIHFPELVDEVPELLARMREANVGYAVAVCTDWTEVDKLRDLVTEHDELYATVGIHPNTDRSVECEAGSLTEAINSHEKFVAIGECGLDYHYEGSKAKDWQAPRMDTQAEVALTTGNPLVVHTRDSIDDTIDFLVPRMRQGLKAVLHCFTGTWEQASRALDEGFFLSFTGIVTFKNATELLQVATKVPDDRIMVETDSPYLAPVPLRGQRNEPSYVRHTNDCIANERGIDAQEFAKLTTDNALAFYDIKA